MLCHLQTRANEKIRAAAACLGAAYKMAPDYARDEKESVECYARARRGLEDASTAICAADDSAAVLAAAARGVAAGDYANRIAHGLWRAAGARYPLNAELSWDEYFRDAAETAWSARQFCEYLLDAFSAPEYMTSPLERYGK